MPRKEPNPGPISAQAQQDLVSEGIENFELPKSVVMKIAKSSIPENVKLQKETVLSLVKGSTVFINYLAATAHDVAQSRQHKSISASDVLKALELLQFADMASRLQPELTIYRDQAKAEPIKKKTTTSGAVKAARAAAGGATSTSASAPVTKGKGKEKSTSTATHTPAGNPLPPPFISTPLNAGGEHPAAESASGVAPGAPMDVDDEVLEPSNEYEGLEDEKVEEEPEEDIDEDEEDIVSDDGIPNDEEAEDKALKGADLEDRVAMADVDD